MNGYFQLVLTDATTSVHIIPPTDGGKPLDVLELKKYLDLKQIEYDLISLNQAVSEGKDTVLLLNHKKEYPVEEMIDFYVTEDKMSGIARFYPPSNNGKLINRDAILFACKKNGVRFGVLEDAINDFLENRKYCTDYCFVKGQPPVQGTDAEITYHFNVDQKAKPKLLQDGSVDFFELGLVQEVKKDEVLATLKPEDRGKYGLNVMGERIKPRDVKVLHLKHGENVTFSEDRLQLIATKDGQVKYSDGSVSVKDVLTVDAVGTSTGNINFSGNVEVKGNVAANFSIKALGDVVVKGVVEGAVIEAGGNIVIERGMNGMGHGNLVAGGNVIVKFLENASCTASGYVHAEALMQSKVSAVDEVTVSGKKGFIAGGSVVAGRKIEAKTLGSEMGTTTFIEVGTDPTVKQRQSKLQKEMEEAQRKIKQSQPMIQALQTKIKNGAKLNPDQVKYFQTILQESQNAQKVLENGFEEMCELDEKVSAGEKACVVATGEVYPGVKVVVSGATLSVSSSYKYARFIKEAGDVKLASV